MVAASRCPATFGTTSRSISVYAARTPPEAVAKPHTITLKSSDEVIWLRNGFTTSGASVWPRKMLALADSVSAPDVRIVFCMIRAMPVHDRLHHAQVVEHGHQRRQEDDGRQHVEGEEGAGARPPARGLVDGAVRLEGSDRHVRLGEVSEDEARALLGEQEQARPPSRPPSRRTRGRAPSSGRAPRRSPCSSMPIPTRRQSIALALLRHGVGDQDHHAQADHAHHALDPGGVAADRGICTAWVAACASTKRTLTGPPAWGMAHSARRLSVAGGPRQTPRPVSR